MPHGWSELPPPPLHPPLTTLPTIPTPEMSRVDKGGVGVGRTDIKVSGEDEEGRDKGVGIFNPDPG